VKHRKGECQRCLAQKSKMPRAPNTKKQSAKSAKHQEEKHQALRKQNDKHRTTPRTIEHHTLRLKEGTLEQKKNLKQR